MRWPSGHLAGAEVVERGRHADRAQLAQHLAASARGRPSPRPRSLRAAGARPGSRGGRACAPRPLGSPRSSRSAGDRLTATEQVEAVAPAFADLQQRPVEHERRQRAAEPAVLGRAAKKSLGISSPRFGCAQRTSASTPWTSRRSPGRPSAGSAGSARRVRGPSRSSPSSSRRRRECVVARRGQVDLVPRCACAWPRTWRRRRAAAARARRGRAREQRDADRGVDVHADPADRERGARSAARSRSPAARRRRLVARREHDRELVAAEPRERVLRLERPCRRGPICRSTSSPAWWPSVSLSSLKPSRSIRSSATSLLAGLDRRAQLVQELARGCRAR